MLCCGMQAFAKNTADRESLSEKTEIKVGYSDNDNMIKIDNDGNFYGYGVDYLNELSKYTGWSYLFVEVEEGERIAKLQSGEIDLLCDVQKECEGGKELLFSQDHSGIEYGML